MQVISKLIEIAGTEILFQENDIGDFALYEFFFKLMVKFLVIRLFLFSKSTFQHKSEESLQSVACLIPFKMMKYRTYFITGGKSFLPL